MKNSKAKNIIRILCAILSLTCCISFGGCLETPSDSLKDFIKQPAGTQGNFSFDMLTDTPKTTFKIKKPVLGQNYLEMETQVSGHSDIMYSDAHLLVNYSCTVIYKDHSSEDISGTQTIILDFKGTGKYSFKLETAKEVQDIFVNEISHSAEGTVRRAN